jgi:hypothetical protein
MNEGYDFRIKLSMHEVSCRYDTPDRPRHTASGNLKLEPYLETTKLLGQWLKRWERIARVDRRRLLVLDTVDVLGNHLWKLALDNEVGDQLIDAYKVVQDKDPELTPPIRIRISIDDDAPDLATLPWEFIRFPGRPDVGHFHLAAEKKVVFSRFLSDSEEREIRRADNMVRVLFIMGLPDTRDTEEEQSRFKAMIGDLKRVGGKSLDVQQLDEWDPDYIARKFADLKRESHTIDIVHLVALCRDEKNGPELLLPADGGGDSFQDPAPVVRALTEDRLTRPEVVVLHLGDWRGEAVPEHFERLAPAFIKAGVPAVLAMQYPMTPLDGSEGPRFMPDFYENLMKGNPIGQAVQYARHGLIFGRPVNRHFGAPVLYMQSMQDGPLLQAADDAEFGEREGLARESTKADPLSQRQSANAVSDIRPLLLEWAAADSPDPYVSIEIERWINSQQWPGDLSTVWKALQSKVRSEDNNATKNVYMAMMRKVGKIMNDRGNR